MPSSRGQKFIEDKRPLVASTQSHLYSVRSIYSILCFAHYLMHVDVFTVQTHAWTNVYPWASFILVYFHSNPLHSLHCLFVRTHTQTHTLTYTHIHTHARTASVIQQILEWPVYFIWATLCKTEKKRFVWQTSGELHGCTNLLHTCTHTVTHNCCIWTFPNLSWTIILKISK